MKYLKLKAIRPNQVFVDTTRSNMVYRVRGKQGNLVFLDLRYDGEWIPKTTPETFKENGWVRAPLYLVM
jgi:hypothetical protein